MLNGSKDSRMSVRIKEAKLCSECDQMAFSHCKGKLEQFQNGITQLVDYGVTDHSVGSFPSNSPFSSLTNTIQMSAENFAPKLQSKRQIRIHVTFGNIYDGYVRYYCWALNSWGISSLIHGALTSTNLCEINFWRSKAIHTIMRVS